MKKGTYTSTNSDLYYKVLKVHHISEDKDYIKLKAMVYYKSNDAPCMWICPYGGQNFKLIYSVVKHWEKYPT